MAFAQSEFHVFPINGDSTKGSPQGDGSLINPWDLQTALSQSSERVNGNDVIWLHEGIYKGRFVSRLNSTNPNTYIIVSAYKDDTVIINGNVESNKHCVMEVKGRNVIYKNFEVTYLGDFSRIDTDGLFKSIEGINHSSGVNCKFQNLIIHNIPGLGFGSWKATGGTVIEDCIIYNNGFLGKKRGEGEGIYVQNYSDDTRVIRNNIIFSNYYKAVEVWSASSGKNTEFVKNIQINNNIIFNSGSPIGDHRGNIIVASNDNDSINIAKHITIKDNVLYHNVDLNSHKNSNKAASLTLGFINNALVQDVTVTNNIIIGQNNAFNVYHTKSANIQNNTIYSGYIHLQPSCIPSLKSKEIWLNNNQYYTKNAKPFRISKAKDYSFSEWKQTFGIDQNSRWQLRQNFKINPVLKIVKLTSLPNQYNVALLERNAESIFVNFSEYNVKAGMVYKIYDIENRHIIAKTGQVNNDLKIEFPMGLKAYEMPLHNTTAKKSEDNFGVYRIVFETTKMQKGFFKRLLDWLF